MEQTEIQKAIEILSRAFKKDLDYRRAWKDNIAMAFKDEYQYQETRGAKDIHSIANNAADKFLTLLVQQAK